MLYFLETSVLKLILFLYYTAEISHYITKCLTIKTTAIRVCSIIGFLNLLQMPMKHL